MAPSTDFVQINCREYANDDYRAMKELFDGKEGLVSGVECGMIYFDNIQYFSSKLRKQLLKQIQKSKNNVYIVSCTDKNQINDEEFLAEFPMMMELPSLVDRPLTERLEMVKLLLSMEAARIKRTLVVKEDLMRCLLLYECDANYHQLRGDIKIGCANAYVREYKSSDEIQLYVSDFEHHVRKGFLRYRMYRKEIAELIPSDYSYSFDGKTVSVNETVGSNLYEQISKKATLLNDNGLDEDEINLLLSAEVERSFQQYQKELVRDVTNKEQLSILVDEKLIELVEEFLQKAESKLDRRFSSSVFYGLCLHIKAVVNKREEPKKLDKNQIPDILSDYKKEYLLSAELAEKIGKEYGMEIPLDEIILITMFICFQSEAAPQSGKPVVLFAFYGEGVATAIVKTIVSLTQLDNVFAYELAYEKDSTEVYDALKSYIASIHQGKGVFVIYDSSFLSEMLSEIEDDLGIFIRQFPAPITTMGIELARKALVEENLDKVYKDAVRDLKHLTKHNENYIVTLCTTGKGGAEELKRYIEKFGQLKDTVVVPLAISDRETLNEAFKKLMKNGVINCVVGTFDPKLYSIPFISISEVFGTKKENLPKILNLEKQAKAKIDYNAMFDYLNEQLEHVNIAKLKRILPEILDAINANITELSLDTEVGLLIHISCCIDRLMGKGASAANPRKKMILAKYEEQFMTLLKIFKPVEKTFGIIISDDEIANILTIIYQL
jgi:transcriptional regulatory protein LevR